MSAPAPVKIPIGRRIVAAIAGAVALLLLAWGAWQGYSGVLAQPVTRVVFAGAVDRLAAAELARLEHEVLAAPSPSIDAIRAAARRVPWVRDAAVRREYPDAVEITFVAHEAFARWNDAGLVSASGEVFSAPGAGDLPQLRGPEGAAAKVVREYRRAAALLAPLGSPVKEVSLSPRGAWHATLASGLVLALGPGDWGARAERFVRAWPKVDPQARAAGYADLRYPSGFALKRVAEAENRGQARFFAPSVSQKSRVGPNP
jgi:cell division protein FtsQ